MGLRTPNSIAGIRNLTPTSPPTFNARLTQLTCFACGRAHDPRTVQRVCTACGMPLRVDYRLDRQTMPARSLAGRPASLWRYREVLPLANGDVTLGEGWTPLVPVGDRLWIKDESRNPTGSFKARGMTMAVSVARAFGAATLTAPSAGNAAGALAAYGARAGIPVVVAMPKDTPRGCIEECRVYGAHVELVPGTISDAGKWLKDHGPADGFDVSTLKEPYRVEGKKTMAYELYEQLDGTLPDVIVYPTGGGTGLVGMAKALDEMRALGWLNEDAKRPRFVSVQAAGCAPVVRGFDKKAERTEPWVDAETHAWGLRVPAPIGGFVCLRALRETGGTAVAIDEKNIDPATRALSAKTGLDICPETGAAWAAFEKLRDSGWITPKDRVVVFNTGTGLKYR
jgi:threonine synthase